MTEETATPEPSEPVSDAHVPARPADPARPAGKDMAATARMMIGAMIGLLAVQAPKKWLELPADIDLFMIGSFGATAVLLYGVPDSPLARPYNVFVGHAISAVLGVFSADLLVSSWDVDVDVAAATAVALAMVAMAATGSLHPPGGATAFIAVKGGASVTGLGYGYVTHPVLLGVAIMFAVAVIVNNLGRPDGTRYPTRWR